MTRQAVRETDQRLKGLRQRKHDIDDGKPESQKEFKGLVASLEEIRKLNQQAYAATELTAEYGPLQGTDLLSHGFIRDVAQGTEARQDPTNTQRRLTVIAAIFDQINIELAKYPSYRVEHSPDGKSRAVV